MVRFASLFDVKDRTVTFLGGKKYSVDTLRSMGAGDLLNSMFDFSEKLINLGLSEEEMSLFTAVVLVSAGGLFLVLGPLFFFFFLSNHFIFSRSTSVAFPQMSSVVNYLVFLK